MACFDSQFSWCIQQHQHDETHILRTVKCATQISQKWKEQKKHRHTQRKREGERKHMTDPVCQRRRRYFYLLISCSKYSNSRSSYNWLCSLVVSECCNCALFSRIRAVDCFLHFFSHRRFLFSSNFWFRSYLSSMSWFFPHAVRNLENIFLFAFGKAQLYVAYIL